MLPEPFPELAHGHTPSVSLEKTIQILETVGGLPRLMDGAPQLQLEAVDTGRSSATSVARYAAPKPR